MRMFLRLVLIALIAGATSRPLDAQDGAPTLYVTTYVEAAPASQGQVAAMLRQLADASRREAPIRFEVLQSITRSNQFVILETWKDQQALDSHTAAAPSRQFREQTAPLLLAPLDQRLCAATAVAPLREARGGVYVVSHIDVGPGGREMAERIIQSFAEQSRKDPGNLRFDVGHQKDKTNHFTAIEVWADQKSGDDHELAAHTRTFRSQIAPLIGALYDQRWYKPL
jgi:autoinducer 2-degrading protein